MDIDALAHRQNVPLQVFSRKTTPILGMGPAMIANGLPSKKFLSGEDFCQSPVQSISSMPTTMP